MRQSPHSDWPDHSWLLPCMRLWLSRFVAPSTRSLLQQFTLRAMSTKTLAVLDESELNDGQMSSKTSFLTIVHPAYSTVQEGGVV